MLQNQASAKLTQKGCETILKASEARGTVTTAVPGQKVHIECRKEHCRPSSIEAHNRKRLSESSQDGTLELRSTEKPFDYKDKLSLLWKRRHL